MLLYPDVDSQRIIRSPGVASEVPDIIVPRSAKVPYTVKFVKDGAIYDPDPAFTSGLLTVGKIYKITNYVATDDFTNVGASSNATNQYFTATGTTPTTWTNGSTLRYCDSIGTTFSLRMTIKETGKFDQDPSAASVTTWVKSGTGVSTQYDGFCNYITTALNAALGVDPPDTSDDITEVILMLELSWVGANEGATHWVRNTLRNNLYKSGESSPVSTGAQFGTTDIGNATDTVTVTFPVSFGTTAWHFVGSPVVMNTTDGTPLGMWATTITSRSATGFTAKLNGNTDSANYDLQWFADLD